MRGKLTAAGTILATALLLTSVSGQQFVPRDENPEDFPAGAGRDDTFFACTACHGFKLIAQQGHEPPAVGRIDRADGAPAQHAAAVGQGSDDRARLSRGNVPAAGAGGRARLAESVFAALKSLPSRMDLSRKSHRCWRLPSVELSMFFA